MITFKFDVTCVGSLVISDDLINIWEEGINNKMTDRGHFEDKWPPTGADPGFEKGGGGGGSGARSQDFFSQFRGLLKEFGAKRGGRDIF